MSLFGRERERAVLEERLEDALAGRGSLVLIAGEAGIGKTSLVRELAGKATASGMRVLTSACHDLMVTPPYGPWLQIFSQLNDTADSPPLPGTSQQEHIRRAPSQDALFADTLEILVSAAAESPLMLVLEDLHWTDAASVEFLRYMARRLGDQRILVVATYRDVELGRHHPLYSNLPVLIREAEATRVTLKPLDDDAVRALIRSTYRLLVTDETRLINHLQQRAEGNPFFIGEMLRTLEERGYLTENDRGWAVGDLPQIPVPILVQQVIEGRLTHVDADARQLLAIAAVSGQDVSLDVWRAISGASDEGLDFAIRCAMDAQLLEESSGNPSLRFTHALVREALYHELGLPQRRRLHRLIGEMLAAGTSPDPDAVAYHFQEAEHEHAVQWLIAAGERAQELYAWRTAAERFETALDLLGSTPEDNAKRGWLAYRAGLLLTYADAERSISHLQDAERMARLSSDRLLEAYALADRGLLRCLTGDVRRGLSEMQDGVDGLDALPAERSDGPTVFPRESHVLSVEAIHRGAYDMIGHSTEINTRRGALIFWLAWSGRYADAVEMGEPYIRLTPNDGDMVQDSLGDALAGLGHAYAALGRPDEALTSFAQARDTYQRIDHHFKVGNTAIYELSEAFLPYRADRIMEREWLADQAEAG